MKNKNVLLTVLGAAAGGALLGVLFAPDKGTETRRKIADRSRDTVDKLKTRASNLVSKAEDRFDTVKSEGRDLVNMGKSKFEDSKKDLRHATS